MASPGRKAIDGEPEVPVSSGGRARHDSGTRPIYRTPLGRIHDGLEAPFELPEEPLDPWDSDPPPSLLSVASWLVDSVRGRPETRSVDYAPSITVMEDSLSAEELAAVDRDDATGQPVDPNVEVGQAELSFEEAQAIDDLDLAPLRHSFKRGDHLGLLAAAEALLEVRPDMMAALRYLAVAREHVRRRYITELGGQRETPRRLPNRSNAPRPTLQPDETAILGLIDGQSTIEEIIDRSELGAAEALQLLDRLCALGLVSCGARHASYC